MTSDTIKCDSHLNQYAADLAEDIVKLNLGDGFDRAMDMAHEYADASEHVIYYHKAHAICQNCNTDAGEDYVSETGEPEGGWSYDGFAVAIAYGELHHRILVALAKKGIS